jgi:hypothetical protein
MINDWFRHCPEIVGPTRKGRYQVSILYMVFFENTLSGVKIIHRMLPVLLGRAGASISVINLSIVPSHRGS